MPIFRFLFLLFLLVPLLEIYLLIKVGGIIGAIPTIFLIVASAVLGVFLVRRQGISTARRARVTLAHGELPAVSMLEGLFLLMSGVLLLIPGFMTDVLGLLGLIPPLRRGLIRGLLGYAIVQGPGSRPTRRGPRVIEGEYRREDDKEDNRDDKGQ